MLSAQRLTAIRGKSLPIDSWQHCSSIVLNALRQSEENHTAPPYFNLPNRPVLNALRQSEENHSACFRGSRWTGVCSTPYGNQRKITSGHGGKARTPPRAQRLTAIRGKSPHDKPVAGIRRATVLNALRQSEENHTRGSASAFREVACSTPYGNQRKITGCT